MLQLTNKFFELFNNYYARAQSTLIVDLAEEAIRVPQAYQTLIMDALNVMKASSMSNETFDKFAQRISKLDLYEGLNAEKFALDIAFLHLLYSDPENLQKKIESKLKREFPLQPRNFYHDMAREKYGKIDARSVAMIKNAQEIYSVDKPTPDSWDHWFYNMCLEVASNSKCFSRKIGAVLVRDKSIISTGYNGPPRGVPTCDKRWFLDKDFAAKYGQHKEGKEIKDVCPRRVIGFPSGQGLEICPAGHAERNALINAARHGTSTRGYPHDPTTLYMSCGVPCSPCLIEIINAGVTEIVVTGLKIYDETAEYLLNSSDLKIRLFKFVA